MKYWYKVSTSLYFRELMYGYEQLIDILPEQILQKVTEIEIFSWIMGEEIDVSQRYTSPFRTDTDPGCRFDMREDGTLVFIDFGDIKGKRHRNCFNMVMDYYNCPFQTSLKLICNHFGLSNNPIDYNPVVIKPVTTLTEIKAFPTIIKCDTKPYERKEKLYWSNFLIKMEHLEEDGTINVSRVTIESSKGSKSFIPFNVCFGYTGFKSGHLKLYQPYNHPDYKWLTNCDENDIGNISNLPVIGKELIIQKSYKDHRVLRNIDFGLTVVWFQNEGCIPDLKILFDLTVRFELITIFFDNDAPGIEAASKLMKVLLLVNPQAKVRMVYLPPNKTPHKDPGEFINREGKSDLREILKQIGIAPKT